MSKMAQSASVVTRCSRGGLGLGLMTRDSGHSRKSMPHSYRARLMAERRRVVVPFLPPGGRGNSMPVTDKHIG